MSEPTQPDPQGDRPGQSGSAPVLPDCIAYVLNLVRALLDYGRCFDQSSERLIAHKEFPTLAAAFGTFDTRQILAHIQRGILRAMMLEKYLLALAAKGRDIEPKQPRSAEPEDIEALKVRVQAKREQRMRQIPNPRRLPERDPDDPMRFYQPTTAEIYKQVCRRSIGRSIAEICMDLGIRDKFCHATFWYNLYLAVQHHGGDFGFVYDINQRRQETFEKLRDRRPHTGPGHWYWRDRPRETFHELFGCWIGEPAPDPDGPDPSGHLIGEASASLPPDPPLATAPP